jgi:signal transduction histidine kinase
MQVLNILLSNAIKYTYKGGVRISYQVDNHTSMLGLKVEDTGIGIPERNLDSLFSEKSVKLLYKQRGFTSSLVICKSLAQALGGDIDVHSQCDKGSVFTFWHPISLGIQKRISNLTQTDSMVNEEVLKAAIEAQSEEEDEDVIRKRAGSSSESES